MEAAFRAASASRLRSRTLPELSPTRRRHQRSGVGLPRGAAHPAVRRSRGRWLSSWYSFHVRLHEGHHPIRSAKRDGLVVLGNEPCPRSEWTKSSIQVRKQRLRDGVEQSTFQRRAFLVP